MYRLLRINSNKLTVFFVFLCKNSGDPSPYEARVLQKLLKPKNCLFDFWVISYHWDSKSHAFAWNYRYLIRIILWRLLKILATYKKCNSNLLGYDYEYGTFLKINQTPNEERIHNSSTSTRKVISEINFKYLRRCYHLVDAERAKNL